jgi:hypothetical protein
MLWLTCVAVSWGCSIHGWISIGISSKKKKKKKKLAEVLVTGQIRKHAEDREWVDFCCTNPKPV